MQKAFDKYPILFLNRTHVFNFEKEVTSDIQE